MDDEMRVVDESRRILREGARMMLDRGCPAPDVAIGAVWATFDLAELFAGLGLPAVEWLRTAADVIERQVLSGSPRKPG